VILTAATVPLHLPQVTAASMLFGFYLPSRPGHSAGQGGRIAMLIAVGHRPASHGRVHHHVQAAGARPLSGDLRRGDHNPCPDPARPCRSPFSGLLLVLQPPFQVADQLLHGPLQVGRYGVQFRQRIAQAARGAERPLAAPLPAPVGLILLQQVANCLAAVG